MNGFAGLEQCCQTVANCFVKTHSQVAEHQQASSVGLQTWQNAWDQNFDPPLKPAEHTRRYVVEHQVLSGESLHLSDCRWFSWCLLLVMLREVS